MSDAAEARAALASIAADTCFTGYVEVSSGALAAAALPRPASLFAELSAPGCAAGSYALNDFDDVWGAVRHFFTAERRADGRARRGGPHERATGTATYGASKSSPARSGLKFHPVDFEAVPDSFMMEIAVYGLPVRMPHWSFGVRYIYQLIQRHMGHSRLFEVVFPGNPGHAYLAASNGLAENILVTAHVLGHADFSRNNLLFRRCQEQVSERIVEHAANHARQIQQAIETHGAQRVEAVLDAALALEQHIDIDQALRRERYPEYAAGPEGARRTTPSASASRRWIRPAAQRRHGGAASARRCRRTRSAICCGSSRNYAPEMESWERDIFLAVREESFYFYPVFATQIMNEGWASYWHARLLREADFVPQQAYVDAIKCHSDVVRPIAADAAGRAEHQSRITSASRCGRRSSRRQGLDAARRIMEQDDDFGFVRNHLTRELAEELGLFRYNARSDGQVKVLEPDLDGAARGACSRPKYNFGAPVVSAAHVRNDGTLELTHDSSVDGRGLDLERSRKVLDYLHRVWRRPIVLTTVNQAGSTLELTAP